MNTEEVRGRKRIGVAGSMVLDILPVLDKKIKAEELIAEGKLTEASCVKMYLGGAVGNTGLALKKLGANPIIISKVGNDEAGWLVRQILEKENVDKRISVCSQYPTTTSIAFAIPDRDKSTIHSRGASQTFTAADLDEDLLTRLDWFHFGYPTTMKTLYEQDGKELEAMLSKVKSYGIGISLDTSLPDLKTECGQVDWKRILPRILPYVDLFLPSAEEAMFLFDIENYKKLIKIYKGKDLIDVLDRERIQNIGEIGLSMGTKAMLIKCGKRGLYLRTGKNFTDGKWRNRRIWCPPFIPEAIVSTTGAGDTAIAGFLQAFFQQRSPEQALCMAAFTAAKCIESYDTVSRITDFEYMEQMLERGSFMDGGLKSDRLI